MTSPRQRIRDGAELVALGDFGDVDVAAAVGNACDMITDLLSETLGVDLAADDDAS